MPKTLADMSLEEREACVGMWCEVTGEGLAILMEDDGQVDYHDTAGVMFPQLRSGGTYVIASVVTPRFDLPRAWGKDGQPPSGHYEEANGGWDEDVNEPYHWPMRSTACNEYCSPFDKLPAEYRRWVSDWEQVEGEDNEQV